jgi:hypothetical protein
MIELVAEHWGNRIMIRVQIGDSKFKTEKYVHLSNAISGIERILFEHNKIELSKHDFSVTHEFN